MTPPSRLRTIFEEALEAEAADRRDVVRRACAGDSRLEARVLALLGADEATGPTDLPLGLVVGALLDDVDEPDDEGGDPDGRTLASGTRIGPWRVVRELGRGGMGTVYLAERDDGAFRRRVALKVVRAGRFAGQLERRFMRERQILARMDHPGIARLLDGGVVPGGHPWLAMQLVEGEPVTEWADRRGLGLGARVRLFLEVCDAVQYAHRRMVVHRDLKPSNIVVTEAGEVRLLDFGIAALLEGEAQDDGVPPTRTGMLLLTPEYAAPEQLRGEETTAATDVHGLGVVLYELLAGRRPRESSGWSWSELVRVLEEEPAPLSLRDDLAGRRRDPDLQAVLARALAREPARRYPSVEAFRDDLRRWMEGRPVRARPDGAAYRLRKFVRRNALATAAATALGIVLVAGLAGTTWMAAKARRETARAEAVRAFLFGLWEAADPDRNLGRVPSALDLVDRGAERLDSLAEEAGPAVRVDMLSTLGWLYRKTGAYGRAVAMLERAVEESRAAYGDDERTGSALDGLAQSLVEAGDFARAEEVARESVRVRSEAGAPPTALAGSWSTLGALLNMTGRHGEAREAHARALELDRSAAGAVSAAVATDRANLAAVLRATGDLEAAENELREVVRIRRTLPPSGRAELATGLAHLANVRRVLGDYDEAEALQREALDLRRRHLGPEHPDVALSLDQLAITLIALGRSEEAEGLLVEALALRERTLPSDHPDIAAARNDLATARFRMGRYETAAEAQEGVVAAWRRTYGDEHARTATGIHNLGVMSLRAGRPDVAERHLAEALAIRRRLGAGSELDVAASLRWMSELRREQRRPGEAERLGREALALFAAALPENHPRVAEARLVVGSALVEDGRPAEALEPLRQAVAVREGAFPEGAIPTAEAHLWLGIALGRTGGEAEARTFLERARAAYEAAGRSGEAEAVRARAELAHLPHG